MRSKRTTGREGRFCKQKRNDQGMVLLAAVVMMTGLIFIATTSSLHAVNSTKVTAKDVDATRTFYAAEAAVEWGTDQLRDLFETSLYPSEEELEALYPPYIGGYTFEEFEVSEVDTLTEEVLTAGDYQGLIGYVQRYAIRALAASERGGSEIEREIQHQFIPLFQFGVFYDEDLEIFPGPAMTFVGRIHTNGDLYMGSNTGIQCESYVTAVGQYWHHRNDNQTPWEPVGYVRVKDALGVYQNAWRGSYWLDNRITTWYQESLELWGGKFRDRSHGLTTLRLPLPPAADQHIIIERPVAGEAQSVQDVKYWYKAGTRYLDGQITNDQGVVLNQPGVYTYVQDDFWDDRQDQWVDCVNIDVAAMIAGNYVPTNRIIYVSSTAGNWPCVRILNAGTLPNGGLTIATDLPLYVQGHYNNVSKKGSALLCDAITLLSPNWQDNRSNQVLANRPATAMTMNACVMTGHVATIPGGNYSGGFENLFRFLETWTNIQITYRGSVIDLWYSQRATAPWVYGGYYTAPNRNWGFDTDLLSPNNWPPGTPRVHTVQRAAWRQIS